MTTRVLLLALVVTPLVAGEAKADPPDEKTDKAEKADKKKAEKARPADLQVKPGAARINLFPTQVFQKRSTRTKEKQRRMTLGDDRDWKVQAAQVGAMIGIFGALAGLCNGGKCLIPDSATDVLPDWMKSEEPVYSNPRDSQSVRSAR